VPFRGIRIRIRSRERVENGHEHREMNP